MGRSPCCAKQGLNRGAWTAVEDQILRDYINIHGEGNWRDLPKRAGLNRCGKSCRLRWLNYLRPDIKRGNISLDEEDLIIRLHKLLGNRWSLIAGRLPGRTDNEIKNYWNTNIGKRLQARNGCDSSSRPPHDQGENNPAFPNPSSRLVRTKATRCDKVVINLEPDHQKPELVEPPVSHDSPDEHPVVPETFSAFALDNDESDFILDFEMDEMFLSEILSSDFGTDSISDVTIQEDQSSQGSNQAFSFSDDFLHCSGL